MSWLVIIVALVAAVVLFKFLVKPLFKVVAILALAFVVWLLLTNYL
jgi:hypothetical protein